MFLVVTLTQLCWAGVSQWLECWNFTLDGILRNIWLIPKLPDFDKFYPHVLHSPWCFPGDAFPQCLCFLVSTDNLCVCSQSPGMDVNWMIPDTHSLSGVVFRLNSIICPSLRRLFCSFEPSTWGFVVIMDLCPTLSACFLVERSNFSHWVITLEMQVLIKVLCCELLCFKPSPDTTSDCGGGFRWWVQGECWSSDPPF